MLFSQQRLPACGSRSCERQSRCLSKVQHSAPSVSVSVRRDVGNSSGPGTQHARSSWVCRAEAGPDGSSQIITGPISVNPLSRPASDPVTAASEVGIKAVDRSKGLWTRCEKCGVILYIKHLREHHHICFGCNYHLKMSSQERVEHLIDPGTWRPLDETLSPCDPLEFADVKNYTDRIKEAQEKTGLQDGVRTGTGTLHGIPVALGVMDFSFMGGSMGSVVGEKLTRLIEYATQEGLAVLVVCTSGGARMQEGILSLMQMAKISGALHVHQSCANLLYISILTSPTTGGVTASFGMLGDIIIAEPQAIIGFAGRRVIEQTLAEQLPDDFQTAEYLLEHGLLDLVVPRSFLKGALYEIMSFYKAAPYKERGSVPFGVQHSTFLTTEEKVRRQMRAWNGSSSGYAGTIGNGSYAGGPSHGSELALSESNGNGSSGVSYRDLVQSFQTLVGSSSNGAEAREMAGDNAAVSAAMNVAKGGRIEWVEAQDQLLADKQFVFRMSPGGNSH